MWSRIKNAFRKFMIKMDNGFLCDTCRYNHPNTCARPERPNAKSCGEYVRK